MNELIAGTIAAPKDLPADAVGSVGTPNTLPADSAGIVGTPNTLPADGAGIIAAPISLPSQGAAALPRSLTPMVEFDFAAKRYVKDGVAVAFEDIFTYTRASSATFTNRRLKKNGGYEYFLDTDYVGSVENLLTYSEDFSDSDWVKTSTSVIANTTKNHLGDKTADKFAPSVAASIAPDIRQAITSVIGTIYTFSIYVKAGKSQFIQVLFPGTAVAGTPRANFDVKNGLLGTIDAPLEVAINDAGDGWYKISVSVVAASTAFAAVLNLIDSATDTRNQSNTWAIGDGVYIWGAQVTQSAKALPYVKTLDVAVTKTFAETLRTEYDAATGENLGALIEGGSTNLARYSEEFSPNWSRTDSTVLLNQTTAPDNTVSADLIYPNTSGMYKQVYRAVTGIPITTYTSSFYVKSAGISWVMLPSANATAGVWFDLINGVMGTETAGTSGTMLNLGNGWFKCSVTSYTIATVAYSYLRMADGNGLSSVTANGTSGVYIWGAQLEALPFASSYIRTEGAAVSRSADVLSVSPYDAINPSETSFNVVFDSSTPITDYPMAFRHNALNSEHYRLYGGTSPVMHIATDHVVGTGGSWVVGEVQNFSGTYDGATSKLYVNKVFNSQDAISQPLVINPDISLYIGMGGSNVQNINGHISKFSTYAQALTQQEITLL